MATDFVDNDTLAAVGNLWRDSPTLRGLIPEPHTGALKSGQPSLYAHAACELDRRDPAGTGTGGGIPWHDYRMVTLTILGVKAAVAEAVETALAVFHQKAELTFPSRARFMQWWPVEAGRMEQDPDGREGKDQWRGIITGRVWSIRVSGE